MDWMVRIALTLAISLLSPANAASFDPDLVGTWTTSARTVFTGPDFYNPVDDRLAEPSLPGISYSFTSDGWYEEAYYRTVANPAMPNCPSGIMQWQHGRYVRNDNGSLTLTPIAVDGRQLQSSPCAGENSLYTQYSQWELFKWYEVVTDNYHGVKRLNLYKFDGSPMNPMYLAYYPTPQMLPTQTLNPTSKATGAGSKQTSTSNKKRKRSLQETLAHPSVSKLLDPDRWWWLGVLMTGAGGVAYFAF